MKEYSDLTIKCKQCGKDFIFSEDEQDFYKTRGFSTPQRCKSCRSKQRQYAKICAECGNKFVEDAPVYCAACMINQKLEFEQKIADLQKNLESMKAELASQTESGLSVVSIENQKSLDEAVNRAKLAEAAEKEVSELLQQRAREVAELKVRLDLANSELEKAVQYRSSMEKLVPALESLLKRMSILENNQKAITELLLKLSNKTEVASKTGILETIKGFFRSPDSPASSS